MRVFIRSVLVALFVVGAAVMLALTATMTSMTSVFTLTVAADYIVRGTQFAPPFCWPRCGTLVTPQQNIDLATPYIDATVNPPAGQPNVFVDYPASFRPLSVGYFHAMTYDDAVRAGVAALPSPGTIDSGSVIFGYSQGADVATQYKRSFNQYWANNPGTPPEVSFVLIGNGNRPNGGAMERFRGLYVPGLDFTFSGATPTTTAGAAPGQITTYDIARQYDGFADFPTNPLNPFATANAVAGLVLVHSSYQTVDPNSAVFQATQGDTAYYLIPTYPVPLLMPIAQIPVVGPIVADTLDPVMRVLVESGYDRTVNPGTPSPANIFYYPNPVKFAASLVVAVPTGLVIGLQDLTGQRTPGTPPEYLQGQGAYGIFGPPVTLPNQTPPPAPLSQVMVAASVPSDQPSTVDSNSGASQQVSNTQAVDTAQAADTQSAGTQPTDTQPMDTGAGQVTTQSVDAPPAATNTPPALRTSTSTRSLPPLTKPRMNVVREAITTGTQSLPPLTKPRMNVVREATTTGTQSLPPLTKPRMNVVRGATTGKPALTGPKDVASSVKGAMTKSITAVGKALGTKPPGARTPAAAGTGNSGGEAGG